MSKKSIMSVDFGFDLKSVRSYVKPETAALAPEKALADQIGKGLMFNVLVVSQRKGGLGTDAEDLRYIPILSNFRGHPHSIQCAINAAKLGFTTFA